MKRRHQPGFSLIELLMVCGILAVLLAILLPAISKARDFARQTGCLGNMGQLALGYRMYAIANDGLLCPPNTGAGTQGWVAGGRGIDPIKQGLLFPYVLKTESYQCPADAVALNYRSYSIQAHLAATDWSGIPIVYRITAIPDPTATFNFIEEQDLRPGLDGYNLGSFVMNNSGDTWVDYPVARHRGGTNLGFCDGHSEYWHWSDPRTLNLTHFANTPNNPDLKRLEAAVGY